MSSDFQDSVSRAISMRQAAERQKQANETFAAGAEMAERQAERDLQERVRIKREADFAIVREFAEAINAQSAELGLSALVELVRQNVSTYLFTIRFENGVAVVSSINWRIADDGHFTVQIGGGPEFEADFWAIDRSSYQFTIENQLSIVVQTLASRQK